ncbi:MAG: hypothetical protein MNSN_07740 [Minisyncoccus archaeiphilus]|uniref:hypothetical protein n=1 Tax=Minisyncoccus archaeiphilus TaxID=3238481 RepID=UPI0009C98F5B|nr:MAG: hypothetical protein BWY21_01171 [Parcubacteria group bacterium ADurb.Bin216]GMX59764.1 MAG: hypothetical protein MNSN_07740 [Candidatus Parcubacteria bacterium]
MKKYIYIFALFFLFLFDKVQAVCPICTVAVGAGVGLSRWLGIDDSIIGLWVGGLTVSMIVWTISWLESKKIGFTGMNFLSTILWYALMVIPLYFMGIIGHPYNALGTYGIDKLLMGIVIGSIGFYFGAEWYFYLKEKNGGHAYFPFQKVVMPISPLILMSIVFYLITA